MKTIITVILLFIVFDVFSQNFVYNKVFTNGQIVKIKGKISISDTLLIIETNKIPASFGIIKTSEVNNIKTYKSLKKPEYHAEARITLNYTENEPTLFLETKDDFSGSYNNVLYYLKDEKN